ncbi:MAG: hypothetical protein AseanaTS_05940 [Candidatus Pelagadaptatus aseana]|uniref:hypothetical protein n=1 Tax=Candidatus Pelagadaptatus aseana TaxID=3120508 RepID=UPI0039B1B934
MSLKDTLESRLHSVETYIAHKLDEIKAELDEQHHIDYEANLAAFEEKWQKIGKRVHSVEHVVGKVSPKLEHEIEEQFQIEYKVALEAFQRKWKDEIAENEALA